MSVREKSFLDCPSLRASPTARGYWMQTATGRAFYPFDPRPEDIFIEDIAAGLSRQCRYAGQLRADVEIYSTAEHCVALARHFRAHGEIELAKWALLHDAAEAYLNDIVRPVKQALAAYRGVEALIMAAICDRFGLPRQEPAAVKDADRRILMDERRAVMASPSLPWATDENCAPLNAVILCYPPRMARFAFLHLFGELFGEGDSNP